jgi:type III restriction enzyme
MVLKGYQERALGQLRYFLERCRAGDFAAAHAAALARTDDGADAKGDSARAYARRSYMPVEGLEAMTPYCCIRLPTGGGKTLLAAHAIKVAGEVWMERARPPVLWLVPSNQVVTQTLSALKKPRHPYRQAVADAFGVQPAVFDIDERRQISPQDFIDKVVVIVATYQSFRIENADLRNVYRTDENLERHFRDLHSVEGLDVEQDEPRKGRPKLSFANLLYRQRPLMILDEAHNFMTGLSAVVKQRLNPSAIIEFTATPKPGSNVISAATAMELKAEDMIKMPVHLTQHTSWQAAVASARQNRDWLAKIGAADPARIRPIVLYQAQADAHGNEATVDKLKAHLRDVELVAEDAIAVVTGDQHDLDGIDLFDPKCRIEHVITVQALKEGWDCSYAYIFCSLQSLRSAGAVEQLLGRVLRMPFATRRASEELNRAYAHVSEASFHAAAQGLTDRLTEMGFDERAARAAVIETPPEFAMEGGTLAPRPTPPVHRVAVRPDMSLWSAEAQQTVRMVEIDGAVDIVVPPDAPEPVRREVARHVEPFVNGSVESVERYLEQVAATLSPAQKGVAFRVPQMHLLVQGELELAEPETFIELAGWNLLDDPAKATLPDFSLTETADGLSFDIDGDQVTFESIETTIELALDERTEWDAAALARFLDREAHQIHTPQPMFLEWCRRTVERLIDERGFSLAALVRGKYLLRRAMAARLASLRETTARKGVEMMLTGLVAPEAQDGDFAFPPYSYNPAQSYQGAFRPAKHFYAVMAHMEPAEAMCALEIDRLPKMKHWVRNLERAPGYSLPTSKGRFYPDFVAELDDGRVFVIEYKGRVDAYDREKDNIGKRFAEASSGKLRFVTVWEKEPDARGRDIRTQLMDALRG